MRKRNALMTGSGRKMTARLLALSLMMSQLTSCSLLKPVDPFSKPVNAGASENTDNGEISEEALPEGTSPAGAALPSGPPSFQVGEETFDGKQVLDAGDAKAFLADLKDEIGFSDISEFSDAASHSTSSANVYRFTQMAGGLPVEGRGIRVLTDPEGQVIDINGKYLDPAEIDSEVLVSSEEACQAVTDWFASEEGGKAAEGGSVSGAVGKAKEIVKILTSPEEDAAGRIKSILNVFGAAGERSRSGSGSDSGNESDSESGEIRQIVQGCVICSENEKAQAAWKTLAFADGSSFQCYVSARDGSVLSVRNLDCHESAVGSGEDAGGNPAKFNTEYLDGTYWLEDEKARVRVFDVEETELYPDFCIRSDFLEGDVFFADFEKGSWDPEGELGFPILLNNTKTPGHDYRLIVRDEKLAVTDNGTVICPDVFVEPVFNLEGNRHPEVLQDDDNLWTDARAVSVMEHLQEADRYWREVMVRNGWDDRNSSLVFGLNADTDNSATNVWEVVPRGSEPWKSSQSYCAGLLKVNPTYSVAINVIAHEYAHAVIKSYVNLGKDYKYGEASAIHEGLADLFSELTEKYIKGDCDWIANNRRNKEKPRNMKDPFASDQPAVYQDANWSHTGFQESRDIFETNSNSDAAHHNSTVISHLGYLIDTGKLEKPEKTKALGDFLTGRLFYNTFPQLEENTSFADYASILYMEAVRMFRVGQMSAEEVYCVYRALEEAGLLPVFDSGADGNLVLESLNSQDLTGCSVDIYTISQIEHADRYVNVIRESENYHRQSFLQNETVLKPALPSPASDNTDAMVYNVTFYKVIVRNNEADNEDFSFILRAGARMKAERIITPFLADETLYYEYLRDTYGTGESDLVSAYVMDFDLDGRKDLLTVTKGSEILANTPLGPFGLYNKETNASTLDLNMYQLDEQDNVVRTGTILGAGTVEGHSRGTMAVSVVLQDGKPYICGYSTNEDTTTYGARPYVIYEFITGEGFRYDHVSGISWGQSVMGKTDDKDPNKIAGTYGLDIRGTQLSEWGEYGVLLCEASADNIQSPRTFTANDYTMVKEGMEKGYGAAAEKLDAMHEEMVLDAKTFEERKEQAKESEAVFERFVEELEAAGAAPVLEEYRTDEEKITGIYTCRDVDMIVSINIESKKPVSIDLYANGYPVPDSWYPVKDAVLRSSFAGLDQGRIGELLGRTRTNLSASNFDAGPATILAGNTGRIILRIMYK